MGRLDDFLYRLLYLEEQLESYKRLHAEEQQAMARSLGELRREIVGLLSAEHGRNPRAGHPSPGDGARGEAS